MGTLSQLLENVSGKANIVFYIENKPAFIVHFKNKEIKIEVKNPILALEFGIQEMFKKNKADKPILSSAKKLGFKIKIKYKFFELEL
ncbi:MAG: hypothetical protein ABIF08_02715 [Nanoarchaeota archaeon]